MRVSVVLLALCCATPAFARSQYQNQIPNGLAIGCLACHPGGVNTQRNLFGEDVRRTLVNMNVDWAALWMLDSDNDGQTNGQELGDPCGVWRVGQQPARRNNISNPGLAGSTSATPDEPACGPPDAGIIDTGAPVDTGIVPDAGGIDDTGVAVDTGVIVDAGVVVPDAGNVDNVPIPDVDGCRCVGAPRFGASLWFVLVGAFVLIRRRRIA